jgi:hypothetical protein
MDGMRVSKRRPSESPVNPRSGVRRRWLARGDGGLIPRPRAYGDLLRREPSLTAAVELARSLAIVEEVSCLRFADETEAAPWTDEQRAVWRRARSEYAEAGVIEPAAARVFAAVQAVLVPLEGERLGSASLRGRVARAARQSRRALEPTLGTAGAKRVQLAAAGGRPLTVCVECNIVFADSASTQGPHPFRKRCTTCAELPRERRAEVRDRRLRAFEAGMEEIAPGVWWGACKCGRDYTTDRIDRRRCDRCQRGHR